ncbi:MAG: hypothetical protein ABIA74_05395 [bacterium]
MTKFKFIFFIILFCLINSSMLKINCCTVLPKIKKIEQKIIVISNKLNRLNKKISISSKSVDPEEIELIQTCLNMRIDLIKLLKDIEIKHKQFLIKKIRAKDIHPFLSDVDNWLDRLNKLIEKIETNYDRLMYINIEEENYLSLTSRVILFIMQVIESFTCFLRAKELSENIQ